MWVDVANEGPATIRRVCRQFEIDEFFVDEALAVGSLPLIETQPDLVYLILNSFHIETGGRLASVELDVFLGPGYLITVHVDENEATRLVMDRIEQGVELAPPTPAGLLAHIAMVGSRRFPPLIEQLETQLDDLEDLAMTADPRAIVAVQALRRDVIVLRRVLAPQREIYFELAESGHQLVDKSSRRLFQRVSDYQAQLLESLEAARSLLGSVLETHRGAVGNQTNEIVRVLTVFSAIMLPLGLVASVYGMNFVEIPLADHPQGFWILVGAMVLAGVGLWLYFGRRGFVGAPRLSELPRAVGLGLYQVGTAPIRVVAEGIESTIRLVTGEPERPDEPGGG